MFINLVTVGAFVGISFLAFLISEIIRNGRLRARAIADLSLENNGTARYTTPPGSFRRALAGAIPQSTKAVTNIEKDLKRAGYYRPWAAIDFLSTRNGLVFLILIGFLSLAVLAPQGTNLPETLLGVGLVTTILGFSLPRLILGHQAKQRVGRIQRGLPDALDIVHMCLSGGLSLRDSLSRVSQEIEFFHPDIAVEFEVIRRHSDADTMAKALRNFADRIDTPDVSALASLVTQADKLGTHVADAVTEFAIGVRRMFQQRAEERANKTSIKLLFPVVLCLAPPIYILLMGPPVLKLKDFIKEGNQPGGVLDTTNVESATSLLPDSSNGMN